MCYSPVRIRNNKHGFNPAVDRQFNVVPCNHCGECMADKRTQYLIRSLCETEYMYLRKSKQIVSTKDVMFCTLTYDNKNLPVLMFPDGKKRSVFRYEDVQDFFNRLESHYYRRGIFFHYLICSEYGHGDIYTDRHGRKRTGTFRPHYHLLLFLKLSPSHLQRHIVELLFFQILIRPYLHPFINLLKFQDMHLCYCKRIRYRICH